MAAWALQWHKPFAFSWMESWVGGLVLLRTGRLAIRHTTPYITPVLAPNRSPITVDSFYRKSCLQNN